MTRRKRFFSKDNRSLLAYGLGGFSRLVEMLIFRIENAKGRGPYRPANGSKRVEALLKKHNCCRFHPVLDVWHPGAFFGFKSLWQLFRWFDKEDCTSLGRARFRIAVYECEEDYKSDRYQCAFVRHEARLVRTISIKAARKAWERRTCTANTVDHARASTS